MQATHGSPIITALDGAWAAIRRRHPEVPAAVVIAGSSQRGAAEGDALNGHHWPEQWIAGPDEAGRAAELFIAAELLAHGGRAVLEALLHAGAHGLATARGIKDTSAAGNRYHNRRFVALAEELGLRGPGQAETVAGWAGCTLPAATAAAYAAAIAAIDEARPPYLSGLPAGGTRAGGEAEEDDGTARRGGRRQAVECECQPPRRLQLTIRQLEVGPVICGVCGEQFRAPGAGHQDDEG
jgi:hypothetical protein